MHPRKTKAEYDREARRATVCLALGVLSLYMLAVTNHKLEQLVDRFIIRPMTRLGRF